MSIPNDLTPSEKRLSKEQQALNMDLPGLFVFSDGQYVCHYDGTGTGMGSTPAKAVQDLRDEYLTPTEKTT